MIEKNDQVLITACNPSKIRGKHMFQVGDLKGDISVLWEDLSLKVSDGAFED